MTNPAPAASGDNITVNRPRHGIPGLGNVTLIAQPSYAFEYGGQRYTVNWDGRYGQWVTAWRRETDGQQIIMCVRDTLEQAVRDAMDDVDALTKNLPAPKTCRGYGAECGNTIPGGSDLCPDCTTARLDDQSPRIPR